MVIRELIVWAVIAIACPSLGYLLGYFTYKPDTRL